MHPFVEMERRSQRPANIFELTLSRSSLNKEHVFYSLEGISKELIVSQEEHDDGRGHHFHVYCKTAKKLFVHEFTEAVIEAIFGEDQMGESVHTSTLKSKRSWVKYITKEDTTPMHKGVDTGDFHTSWKIHRFIERNRDWNPLHHFVRQNPGMHNIVKTMHTHYWNKNAEKVYRNEYRRISPDYSVEWVSTLWDLTYQKNIYLWGPTGTGKTVCVEQFTRYMKTTRLSCGNSQWEFGEIQDNTTMVIAGDAPADYMLTHREMLLQLADRRMVVINQKCGPIKTLRFVGTIIIVSNYSPADIFSQHPELKRRFNEVHASEKGWTESQRPEVKTETDHEEIIISSDEEEEYERPSHQIHLSPRHNRIIGSQRSDLQGVLVRHSTMSGTDSTGSAI